MEIVLAVLYIAAALLFLLGRRPLTGLIGAAAAAGALLTAFMLGLEPEALSAGLLGLLACLLLPGGRRP